MRFRLPLFALTAVLAMTAIAPVAANAGNDDGPQFEGKVTRVDRAHHRFRINDPERGSHRVYVNSRTDYERVGGLRRLRRGMEIEVSVHRNGKGRWIAEEVERDRDDD